MADETIGIVGAGIVGLATGRHIALSRPGTRVVVLEKESGVAVHQTGHNSGVVHAGIYYAPGSLKAALTVRGVALLREYCQDRALPYKEIGKLVVAVRPDELGRMADLYARARNNHVPELREVSREEIREIEPHAGGLAALHSPRTAITDYRAIAGEFARDIESAGGQVRFGFPVTSLTGVPGGVEAGSGAERIRVDRLVLCAGLQSDSLARLAGDTGAPRIVPFRGEYMLLRPERAHLVRGLVYPVPDPRYPFLGVHFTPRVDGSVEVGPNAVLATAREGYRRSTISPRDLAGLAGYPGTWRMAARHWRTGVREYRGSLSRTAFMRDAGHYVPGVGARDVVRGGAGVRAQALDPDGTLVDDFRIHRVGRVTAVRNAPSPAATASMAIAEHIAGAVFGED
ncbi:MULTISPECIES: L-2-hydroxyglutarate oxidase [Streptomyces]|jgi:L-2-hydroxyglutarate oxidase LhgO|uniref:Hydroxyglutarate oxidase n=3 Tax=Streptomyces griseoaurantiacus TaxID=68213 RepID=F3NHP5_9ACTN|nr:MULTISPECIES: L-2-hydroxyglutarate oxidase [Streptomyces]EGG46935.1 hydroxyglutarate oxidase [Streptomyces griseoaurantiacus M045]MBA5225562.1 L-2-hydroxyglutarate oxidase [Streptomyces griseoaurantiacus]MCF0089784.1 L-2-hydroxyglutarate oxidase LhgO [Streptomyces sp. MH192]MCF0102878.1 L-2-hydroxyglutarate oxidase LhgO [Streptomyces sp. MH191]MDX3363713.1 L-2-hydroxyglutarate oxidase [Streptomyces sp. ME02-6978.2a]